MICTFRLFMLHIDKFSIFFMHISRNKSVISELITCFMNVFKIIINPNQYSWNENSDMIWYLDVCEFKIVVNKVPNMFICKVSFTKNMRIHIGPILKSRKKYINNQNSCNWFTYFPNKILYNTEQNYTYMILSSTYFHNSH